MGSSCCSKPITRIIKVAEFDAGLVGLDQALRNVYISGVTDEAEIQQELLKWIKEFGNYVAPTRENEYKTALLREYKRFTSEIEPKPESSGHDIHEKSGRK